MSILELPGLLHIAVSAVAPIDGVSIGDRTNKATWTVSFKEIATPEQRVAAQQVIDAFDPQTVSNEESRALFFQAETDRTELISLLKTATPAQIETFIRNRLNANAVTNLATATQFCKRVETAFVQLVKALALRIQN